MAVWSVFSDTLEKENEAYLNSQKYENTLPLGEANKACDVRFSAFSMNVKAKAKSYVAEVAAAADRIAAAMEPYKEVKSVDYTGEGIEIETIVDEILYGQLREYIIEEK